MRDLVDYDYQYECIQRISGLNNDDLMVEFMCEMSRLCIADSECERRDHIMFRTLRTEILLRMEK